MKMTVFSNSEFGKVRGVEINGEGWLVGKDVAEILGYTNPLKAIRDHVDDEDKGMNEMFTPGGNQKIVVINESGLYALVLCSKLPKAKQFRRWVTSEVLPSIRKNGGYISGQESMSDSELMAKALLVAARTIEERDARIKMLAEENSLMQPKAEYYDALCSKDGTTNLRTTAKELDIPEKQFTKMLVDNKILYRDQCGILVPYAKYAHNGWFKVREKCGDKYITWQTRVTTEGKDALRKILCGGNR